MIKTNLQELQLSKRVLLLQGPIGSFFYDLHLWLSKKGCITFKLNFNGGDRYFYPSITHNTYDYTGTLQDFSDFLAEFIMQNQIDAIVCFGDTRPYHRIAREYSRLYPEVTFWAFEEGYFRPDYITLEKNGVNDFSTLPRNAEYFISQSIALPEPKPPKKVALGFIPMAKAAIYYYAATYFSLKEYSNYHHHRLVSPMYYIKLWVKSGIKRAYFYVKDRLFSTKIKKGKLGDFFIVPLQVYDDSQVKYHCDYNNVEAFLVDVLQSFIHFAPQNTNLLIKHHPMDRGFVNYSKVVEQYKRNSPEFKQRIFYVHDVPMPVILRKAKGMVTLNSTSGISALLHKIPVITLGRANYNFTHLTYQGKLDEFWNNELLPDEDVFNAYRKFHLYKTHINGSYYSKVLLDET
ncbi:capsule biosynthesis protein [Pasteurellaceae bacterium Orientalotternb1]|nr:capsule biosynthesis protein [Pasteurellaceae bacterium Orientalotternb1]